MILLYIDPGAGSMLVQAALAAVLAIPFFFRAHFGRVIQRFRRPPKVDEDTVARH